MRQFGPKTHSDRIQIRHKSLYFGTKIEKSTFPACEKLRSPKRCQKDAPNMEISHQDKHFPKITKKNLILKRYRISQLKFRREDSSCLSEAPSSECLSECSKLLMRTLIMNKNIQRTRKKYLRFSSELRYFPTKVDIRQFQPPLRSYSKRVVGYSVYGPNPTSIQKNDSKNHDF